MGIIIAEMELPKDCWSCRFSTNPDTVCWCSLMPHFSGCADKRPNCCPLKSMDEMIGEIESNTSTSETIKMDKLREIISKYTAKDKLFKKVGINFTAHCGEQMMKDIHQLEKFEISGMVGKFVKADSVVEIIDRYTDEDIAERVENGNDD